jgi:hypothetical protein
MKYAIHMASDAMMYIPSFIKIGSGIQKLIGGYMQGHRHYGDHISLLQGSKLKILWLDTR